MRNIIVVLIVLVLSTLACGIFGGGGDEENTQPVSTETQEVAGNEEPTEIPPEVEPTERTDVRIATETPKITKKDVPIATKQSGGGRKSTQIAPPTTPEAGIPDDYTEVFYPYEVAEYSRGVEIKVLDFRSYEDITGAERFIGIIANTGTVDLYNIQVYIIALDENEEVIDSTFESAHLVDFPVGAKSGFSMISGGDGFADGVDHLLIAFDGMERWEGTSKTQDFEILSAEGQSKSDVVWGIVYEITTNFINKNENDVLDLRATAILYSADGRLVGTGYSSFNDFPDNAIIAPGEEAKIVFSCRNVYGIVNHFEVVIEGEQIFE